MAAWMPEADANIFISNSEKTKQEIALFGKRLHLLIMVETER